MIPMTLVMMMLTSFVGDGADTTLLKMNHNHINEKRKPTKQTASNQLAYYVGQQHHHIASCMTLLPMYGLIVILIHSFNLHRISQWISLPNGDILVIGVQLNASRDNDHDNDKAHEADDLKVKHPHD
jgi:hypothetical protein